MELRFWGVRGPVRSGKGDVADRRHTPCVSVLSRAATSCRRRPGIRNFGASLAGKVRDLDCSLFFAHVTSIMSAPAVLQPFFFPSQDRDLSAQARSCGRLNR
jgi:hypothetical protein